MMLTESENTWLKTRDKKRPYCFYCEALFGTDSCYWKCVTESCAMYPDMKDAALFEARVAAKLATAYADYVKNRICIDFDLRMRCPGFQTCAMKRPHPPCDFAVLKGVRLQVEEEMDANGK